MYTTSYNNWVWSVMLGEHEVATYATHAVCVPHTREEAERLAIEHANRLNGPDDKWRSEVAHREWLEDEHHQVAWMMNGREWTIAEFRTMFDILADEQDWKLRCSGYVPARLVAPMCAALEWYHGGRAWVGKVQPITGLVEVGSDGYAC